MGKHRVQRISTPNRGALRRALERLRLIFCVGRISRQRPRFILSAQFRLGHVVAGASGFGPPMRKVPQDAIMLLSRQRLVPLAGFDNLACLSAPCPFMPNSVAEPFWIWW